MHDKTAHYDYVKAELEYRLGRARADIVGRRARRVFTGRGTDLASDTGDTTFTTVR